MAKARITIAEVIDERSMAFKLDTSTIFFQVYAFLGGGFKHLFHNKI
jgi:hypothetical protein